MDSKDKTAEAMGDIIIDDTVKDGDVKRMETLPKREAAKQSVVKTPVSEYPEVFGIGDGRVVSESNARYIFVVLDDKDRKLLMMMVLPHVRETIMKDGKLVAKAVAEMIDWDIAASVKHSEERIRRLCLIGAIVRKPDMGWVPNPKLISQISQRAT